MNQYDQTSLSRDLFIESLSSPPLHTVLLLSKLKILLNVGKYYWFLCWFSLYYWPTVPLLHVLGSGSFFWLVCFSHGSQYVQQMNGLTAERSLTTVGMSHFKCSFSPWRYPTVSASPFLSFHHTLQTTRAQVSEVWEFKCLTELRKESIISERVASLNKTLLNNATLGVMAAPHLN